MRILITGASGRLGRRLVAAANDHHRLIAVNRTPAKNLSVAQAYQLDLTAPTGLAQIFAKEQPEAVIHLAGLLGAACEARPSLARQVNIEATKSLAEIASANRVKKMIFTSSAAVYHQTELAPTNEESNLGPRSVYGQTKLAAEKILAGLASPNLKITTARIFNIYGPEFDNSLINKLLNSTKAQPVSLLGPENYYRDYIHVVDVVQALVDILSTEQTEAYSTLNIGSGQATNNQELLKILKAKGKSVYYLSQDCALDVSWADIGKARRIINFQPATEIILDQPTAKGHRK